LRVSGFILVCFSASALGITPEAREFLDISKQLEPVQCQKRQLRREIARAQAEQRARDAEALKKRFEVLNRDANTERLEKRLAVLEARLLDSKGRPRHAEDLDAISFQHRQAFYRCE
jgi:hypothetical protein